MKDLHLGNFTLTATHKLQDIIKQIKAVKWVDQA